MTVSLKDVIQSAKEVRITFRIPQLVPRPSVRGLGTRLPLKLTLAVRYAYMHYHLAGYLHACVYVYLYIKLCTHAPIVCHS